MKAHHEPSEGAAVPDPISDCPGWGRRHRRYGYGPEFERPRAEDGAQVPVLPDWLA